MLITHILILFANSQYVPSPHIPEIRENKIKSENSYEEEHSQKDHVDQVLGEALVLGFKNIYNIYFKIFKMLIYFIIINLTN